MGVLFDAGERRNVSLEDAVKELKRELSTRRRVYPGWVASGKLTQNTADHRIEAIQFAIQALETQIPQQTKLFEV